MVLRTAALVCLCSLSVAAQISSIKEHFNSNFLIISGKVVLPDGSGAPQGVAVQTDCQGQVRVQTYTSKDGSFVFNLNEVKAPEVEASSPQAVGASGPMATDYQFCSVFANMPGYLSEKVQMTGAVGTGAVDLGSIVLKQSKNAASENEMISLTSLAAPGEAKKNFEKGEQFERKQNWSAAAQQFQKAVARYEKYADAWTELGRVQFKLKNSTSARQSFHRAITADPRCMRAYIALSNLAAYEQQWAELARVTSDALQVNPDSLPQFWFFNSVANYNLHQFSQAEKSDRRGLSIDPQHRVPKLEYLLGMIMSVKHDYRAAAECIRTYLKISPPGPETAFVTKQLNEVEKLANATPGQ